MKIEIAKHDRMTESGSSLLRLMQNTDMPLLDLLVRETVQNALDATDGSPFVKVDISVKEFQSKVVNKQFEGITAGLDARFPKDKGPYKSLIITDGNTKGLTGPVSYDQVKNNDFGNLLKLVYEISKPQTDEEAGGSWGLGKTIYFRMGIGLVVYYSQIKEGNGYKSRLAACLVEDETKKGSLLPEKGGVKRGIAWWGASAGFRSDRTIPIENDREIQNILNCFGVKPYPKGQTGTTVIVPYIDEKLLLAETVSKDDKPAERPYWVKNVPDYLRVAIQRWYAPRIRNEFYPKAYLFPSVDGVDIQVSKMLPLYRVVRELYIHGSGTALTPETLLVKANAEINMERIAINSTFVGDTSAGTFVFTKLTDAALEMLPPDNQRNPYQQIDNHTYSSDNGNNPIVMYTRLPGMIVGYDVNKQWTHGMPKTAADEFIIGLFILNSKNPLKDYKDKNGKPLSLEEYIRKGEKADHAAWTDRSINGNNPRIVERLIKGVIKKVSAKYTEAAPVPEKKKNTGLGHMLAGFLLPSSGFGTGSERPPKPGPIGPGPGRKNNTITIGSDYQFGNGEVSVDFIMYLKSECRLSLLLATDSGRVAAEKWEDKEKGTGTAFPLSFNSISFTQARNGTIGKYRSINEVHVAGKKYFGGSEVGVEFTQTPESHKTNSITLRPDGIVMLKGRVSIHTDDPKYRGSFELKESKE